MPQIVFRSRELEILGAILSVKRFGLEEEMKKRDIPQTQKEIEALDQQERMKYEIAQELGLFEKVQAVGWKGLTARETGRVGGLLAKRRRKALEEKHVDT